MKRYIGPLSALALLLGGCSKASDPTKPAETKTVSVNIQALNYTAEPFRYVLVDAANPLNKAEGEHISPFSGGGITCCFTLPKHWRPGIQVNVHATHWLSKTDRGDLPEVEKIYTVEVPAYPEGAGELWVLRTADGTIELVTSNVEPDRPQWPGKVKGWPEPSLAYQRERWELYRGLAEYDVKIFRESLDHLKTYPEAHLQNAWDHQRENDRFAIKEFSGPKDPAYADYKRAEYTEALQRSEEELEQLLRAKP